MKPANSYQDASMQPPEQPAWMEAEAERASDFEDAGATVMREQLAAACAACIDQIVESRAMLGLELTVLLQLSNRNKLEALNAFKMIDAAVKQLNHTLAQTRPGAERSAA